LRLADTLARKAAAVYYRSVWANTSQLQWRFEENSLCTMPGLPAQTKYTEFDRVIFNLLDTRTP